MLNFIKCDVEYCPNLLNCGYCLFTDKCRNPEKLIRHKEEKSISGVKICPCCKQELRIENQSELKQEVRNALLPCCEDCVYIEIRENEEIFKTSTIDGRKGRLQKNIVYCSHMYVCKKYLEEMEKE